MATSKISLIEKFKRLKEYCKENNIKLQLSKCCFLAINSNDKEDIVLGDDVIKNAIESVYLGSIITDAGNITCDVKAEIKRKEKKFNQFFAFLTQNRNAPLKVKEKVLESCILSAVIYNCETWGDANLSDLEKKYRRALKYMLGVRKSTCNEYPYIELEKPTLKSLILKRQLKCYNDCMIHKDLPMLRFIIRKAIDANSSFINHYVSLNTKYQNPDDITRESLSIMRDEVKRKAELNRSKYQSFLDMNPLLMRPNIYNDYIPNHKLNCVTRLRLVSSPLSWKAENIGQKYATELFGLSKYISYQGLKTEKMKKSVEPKFFYGPSKLEYFF